MTRESTPFAAPADADLFFDVRHALDHRFSVPPDVQPHVEHGVVTLTGTVQWPFQSTEAESAVRQLKGVRCLINEIEVVYGRPSGAAV